MALILLPKVLEVQICAKCKNYLSFGPIKVYPSKGVTCGRCSKEPDDGTLSTYDKIAENLIFPCVNRFEGCNRLLRYKETAEHEKTCIGGLYPCPLCDEDKYSPNSLLYLLNHYKIFHSRSLLLRPEIHLSKNSSFETSYVYFDTTENLLAAIFVKFDGGQLCVNSSIPGNRFEDVQYRVTVAVNGLEMFKSEFRPCSRFGLNVDVFYLDCSEEAINTLTTLTCILHFTTMDSFNYQFLYLEDNLTLETTDHQSQNEDTVIENYRTESMCDHAQIEQKFPEIYFPGMQDFQIRSHNGHLYWHKINLNTTSHYGCEENIHMYCDFCENYCRSANSLFFCDKCWIFVCSICYLRGVNENKCYSCSSLLDTRLQRNGKNEVIKYSCRFGCKRLFSYSLSLYKHEERCNLNEKRGLTDIEIGRNHFDKYFINSCVGNETRVTRFTRQYVDITSLDAKGKIYVITDNNFECIVFYDKDTDFYNFRVVHRYNPKKYFILNRIVENGQIRTEPNNFSISADSEDVYFVILLREIFEFQSRFKREMK